MLFRVGLVAHWVICCCLWTAWCFVVLVNIAEFLNRHELLRFGIAQQGREAWHCLFKGPRLWVSWLYLVVSVEPLRPCISWNLEFIAMHVLQIVWLYEMLCDCHENFGFRVISPTEFFKLRPWLWTQSAKDNSWWDSLQITAWLVAIRSYCAWCCYPCGVDCAWLAWSWLCLTAWLTCACGWQNQGGSLFPLLGMPDHWNGPDVQWLCWLTADWFSRLRWLGCRLLRVQHEWKVSFALVLRLFVWTISLCEGLFSLADSRVWITHWGAVFVVRPLSYIESLIAWSLKRVVPWSLLVAIARGRRECLIRSAALKDWFLFVVVDWLAAHWFKIRSRQITSFDWLQAFVQLHDASLHCVWAWMFVTYEYWVTEWMHLAVLGVDVALVLCLKRLARSEWELILIASQVDQACQVWLISLWLLLGMVSMCFIAWWSIDLIIGEACFSCLLSQSEILSDWGPLERCDCWSARELRCVASCVWMAFLDGFFLYCRVVPAPHQESRKSQYWLFSDLGVRIDSSIAVGMVCFSLYWRGVCAVLPCFPFGPPSSRLIVRLSAKAEAEGRRVGRVSIDTSIVASIVALLLWLLWLGTQLGDWHGVFCLLNCWYFLRPL